MKAVRGAVVLLLRSWLKGRLGRGLAEAWPSMLEIQFEVLKI